MTLNEQIQANKITQLERKIEKLNSLVKLVTIVMGDDDPCDFYYGAGTALYGDFTRALNDIKGE